MSRVCAPVYITLLTVALSATLASAQEGIDVMENCELIFHETFDDGTMDGWWVEGGQRVWVEDGRLHVKANPPADSTDGYVATVWCHQPFEGDVKIEYDAHVLESATGVNNINFFFHYSYPGEKTLYETRGERPEASYQKYHKIPGYIVTFLKDTREQSLALPEDEQPARVRIRRCPGFNLLAETYGYHCNAGRTYHCEIVKRGNEITFSVDGNRLLTATDNLGEPHNGGLIGLRTFRTWLWWDNIKVSRLK